MAIKALEIANTPITSNSTPKKSRNLAYVFEPRGTSGIFKSLVKLTATATPENVGEKHFHTANVSFI